MGKEALVAYICMRPEHRDADGAIPDHLTVHEKEWAYCPSDVRESEHEWKPTGGATLGELEILVRGMRARVTGEARGENR